MGAFLIRMASLESDLPEPHLRRRSSKKQHLMPSRECLGSQILDFSPWSKPESYYMYQSQLAISSSPTPVINQASISDNQVVGKEPLIV